VKTMRAILVLLGACLIATTPAQRVWDDFLGGLSSQLPWGWQVSGNTPHNTYDSAFVQYDGERLVITMRSGTLYQGYNSIRNVPNLPVVPLRADWRIETRVQLLRNGASNAYVQAGVVLFRDADHYLNYHLVLEPGTNRLFVSTGAEWAGQYQPPGVASASWAPSQSDTVRLLIRQRVPGGAIHFYYDLEDGLGWREASGSPIAPSAVPALEAFLTQGGFVGLYTDTAGWSGVNPPVARFDYLEIEQTPLPQDVNADGCVDDADLLAVLFAFGQSGCALEADTNADRVVDDSDLLAVLFAFGSGCQG